MVNVYLNHSPYYYAIEFKHRRQEHSAQFTKILSKLDGVTICKHKTSKAGLEKALEDLKDERVITYNSKEELFRDLGL